jgi:hypothetical protein
LPLIDTIITIPLKRIYLSPVNLKITNNPCKKILMPLKVSVKLIVLKSGRSGAGTVSGLRKIRKVKTRCDLADPVG